MISPELRFEGFDARSWTNLVSLFSPRVVERLSSQAPATDAPEVGAGPAGAGPTGAAEPAGSLVIVRRPGGPILKAFHTQRGRIVGVADRDLDDLGALATAYGAARALVLAEGVMDDVAERLATRLGRAEDYLTQWLVLARIIREKEEAGLIRIWPRPLGGVPIPSQAMVTRALDILLPDERALVAVLWQRHAPWTAIALRRTAGRIDWVVGPDLIDLWVGPCGGDWRRDYRLIVDAVSHNMAPVHAGLFTEAPTLERLLRSASAGAWARAVAARDVIVHPTPPYATVALTADAVHAIARESARWLGGVNVAEVWSPLARYVRGRVVEIASVTETLGFDPLQALGALLRRGPPGSDGQVK